jgi:transcription factor IIIB subunit 2
MKGHIYTGEKSSSRFLTKCTTITNVERKMNQISLSLKLSKKIVKEALDLFKSTLFTNIIKSKRGDISIVSCLYFVCRKRKTPHLMIDFSDLSQISINKIGVEFLKYTRFSGCSPPIVDPSLFIYRFAVKLQLGTKVKKVSTSALRLIARMKRDWLVSGRRPSGLCGAALLLSTRIHGANLSTKEVSNIVKIGSGSLKTRLREMNFSSIVSLTKKELTKGGGQDGKKESLSDNKNNLEFLPPSKYNSESKDILTRYIKKKKPTNPSNIEINDGENISSSSKHYKISVKKGKRYVHSLFSEIGKLKNSKEIFLSPAIRTSNNECLVKDKIWIKLNSSYLILQTAKSRAQKERPFSYFP